MTHDINTPTTQTKAPATAFLSSPAPETCAADPSTTALETPPAPAPALPAPPADIPLHIGDLLPGLRDAMDSTRMAYHRGDDGQDILMAQAAALDALFVRVLDRATYGKNYNSGKPIDKYVDSHYVDLALRTQRNCRKTIETLTVLREREKLAKEMKEAKSDKYYKRLADEAALGTGRTLPYTETMDKRDRPEN